jgi:VIT1/CCC1 family predicted Fe2+/Mn2+ transporter
MEIELGGLDHVHEDEHEHLPPRNIEADREREKEMSERLKENLKRRKADYHKRIDVAAKGSISTEEVQALRDAVEELFTLEAQLHDSRLEISRHFDSIRATTNFEERVEMLEKAHTSREETRERDEATRKSIREKRMFLEEGLIGASSRGGDRGRGSIAAGELR